MMIKSAIDVYRLRSQAWSVGQDTRRYNTTRKTEHFSRQLDEHNYAVRTNQNYKTLHNEVRLGNLYKCMN